MNDPDLIRNVKHLSIFVTGLTLGVVSLDLYNKNVDLTLKLDKECVEREISDTRERTNQNIKSILRKCEK